MWCAVGREGTGVGSVRGCVWGGHVLVIVMQTTRLENVGAFCGVCSGLARVAVYLYLIFSPRAARWNDFLYFSCNSWRIMQRKTLPGNSPSVDMRPRED